MAPRLPTFLCKLLACGTLASCATAPVPLAEPAATLHVAYEPWPDQDPNAAAAAATLEVEVFALRSAPAGDLVEPQIAAVFTDQGAPFRGSAGLPPGTSLLTGEAARRWRQTTEGASTLDVQALGRTTAVLVAPWTTRVLCDGAPIPGLGVHERGDSLRFGLVASDEAGGQRYSILKQALPVPSELVFVLPSSSPSRPSHAMAVKVTRGTSPEAFAAAAAAAKRPQSAVEPAMGNQLRLVGEHFGEHNRRGALLALAQQLQLPRCVDLLLCADEANLVAIAKAVEREAETAPEQLAWHVERATLLVVTAGLQRADLPPALRACALRMVGALVFTPASLQSLLTTSADAATFDRRLREENLLGLDSRGAAPRVRAHEWLQDHGGSVPGYEPLGPAAEREAALRKHADADGTAAPAAATEVRR